jgi:hypothetical protein
MYVFIFKALFSLSSSYQLDSLHVAEVIRDHINACRENDALASAKAVIIIEANLPGITWDVQAAVNSLGVRNKTFLFEDKSSAHSEQRDAPGSMTTRRNKPEMINLLKDKYLKANNIGFYHNFVTANRERAIVDDIQEEIVKELRLFNKRLVIQKARDGSVHNDIYYTGKLTGGNDDFVMALAMGVYWKEVFFHNEKYRAEW